MKPVNKKPPVNDDELDMLAGDSDLTAMTADHDSTYEEFGAARASWIKLEQGETVLRFLPPRPGESVPWVRFKEHRAPSLKRPIVCPASVPMEDGSRRSCPICKRWEQLSASPDPVAKETAKQLRPKLKVVAEVVDVTSNESEALGVQLFSYGKTIDDALLGILRGRAAVNFTDKRTGCPVTVTRQGTGLKTEYKDIRAVLDERGPVNIEWLRARPESIAWTHELPTREAMEEMMEALGIRSSSSGAGAPRQVAQKAPTKQPTRTPRTASDDLSDLELDLD